MLILNSKHFHDCLNNEDENVCDAFLRTTWNANNGTFSEARLVMKNASRYGNVNSVISQKGFGW
jgi:hypothetical protein